MKLNNKNITRRNFLQKSAVTAGMATMGTVGLSTAYGNQNNYTYRLPREVWIASFSQTDMRADTSEDMVEKVLGYLEDVVVYKPDIVCLPEIFPFFRVKKKYTLEESVIQSEKALAILSLFAQKNNCYCICPVYTSENGNIYIAAVVYDRQGKRIGEYRKTYPTDGEIERGITPGPLCPPVFKTDFGIIGIQICFDVMWTESWKLLREQGAEIVFFPSAFAAGRMLNAKAWQNKYVVVSSTLQHTAKICDITGEEIIKTDKWNPHLICAPVNLEKAFLHIYPYYKRFNEIRQKYGRKINIKIYDEEEWAIIESLSPDLRVNDILQEYEIITHEELIRTAATLQEQARK